MDEGKAPGDFLRQSIQRGVTFEGLLQSTLGVDTTVSRAMQMRRARIDAAESFQINLAIAFVAIGCLASAAVLVLTLRGRHLRNVLRRRAEEETLLRQLAGELSGAVTIRDVAELAVTAAERSSRIAGAFLAKAVDGHLILLSGRGSYASFGGTRTPIPGWLNGGRHAEYPRVYTTEVRAPQARVNHGRPRRSLLIVPLRHEGELIGTFGISSAGGRRRFNASALRFGQALGNLTAVALHRAEALERERVARAEAEQAVRTRDAVVSIVSHDLRNPLTAIIGNADYLLEVMRAAPGLERERTQLMTMKHAADAMNRLIRDLLDVTRLESGPLPIYRKPLDIMEIVDDVLSMFQPVARTRRLTLERENVASVAVVSGDRDRLAQALWNLVGNAVKFTPDNGRVSVRVEPHSAGIRICVSDTGPGIKPEDIPHLFDRFWQASRRDGRGLGLGLFIVKAIVEAHEGTVHVETPPGGGSMFCFIIPRAADDLSASERGDGQAQAARQLVAVAADGRSAPKVTSDGRGAQKAASDGRGAPKVPSPPLVPEVKVQEKHQER
jgi:signal transduction histidine kinase